MESRQPTGFEVAVVGLAGRFPGAASIDHFWRNLESGVESVSDLSEEAVLACGVPEETLGRPDYVKAAALLDDIDRFDARFFGFNPREAEVMDPQQRLFLETAWQALETAGYVSEAFDGTIGVFAGSGMSCYLLNNLVTNPEILALVGGRQVRAGNRPDNLATQTSYRLGLTGPSLSIQTTCSTSLVAVHMACQSLLNAECDMALAGGVAINVPQEAGYVYQPGGVLSPDGRCRAFDANARGTVVGSGLGVVVLRRLEDAVAARDRVRAVILGSAINNDGAAKIGYTAPSVDGQAAVLRAAYQMAELDPSAISYIEAHGTGTELGDPIEVESLALVFPPAADAKPHCGLGSVKSNIGHLDAAAGVAGLIKVVLALEHAVIPPSLNFETPNPRIDFARTPFFVPTERLAWSGADGPRRAGVSAFGIGGTNAHVVLEEAPPPPVSGPGRRFELLTLSARTGAALEHATADLADHLAVAAVPPLADAAYTRAVGRRLFEHRRFVVAEDASEAAKLLAKGDPKRVATRTEARRGRPVVFMFPGQGTLYTGMAAGLYRDEPTFRQLVNDAFARLPSDFEHDLESLFQTPRAGADREPITDTAIAQPTLFIIEYALARLLMGWGAAPTAMIGHSLGDFVAATLAGVFDLDQALRLVVTRGRLMQALPKGAMASLPLGEDAVEALLGEALSLAAINAEDLCTVSGPEAAVEDFLAHLGASGSAGKRLHTSHAFHSAAMDPILDLFAEAVGAARPQPPTIRLLNGLTGDWLRSNEAVDPDFWSRHLRQPVRFADGLARLLTEPDAVFVEIGAAPTLSHFLRRAAASSRLAVTCLPGARQKTPDQHFILHSVGRLWAAGVDIDWRRFYADQERCRIPLPTYPFGDQRYWVDAVPMVAVSTSAAVDPIAAEDRDSIGETSRDVVPAVAVAATRRYPRPDLETPFVAPRDERQQQIARVWAELLGVDSVGIHDDFFELGGHSLLATRVASRLEGELGREIPVRLVLDHPTVDDLALALPAAGSTSKPPIRRHGRIRLPLSFAQRRLWYLDQLEPGSAAYNIYSGVLLEGRLDRVVLARTLLEIAGRHEALRTRFTFSDDGAPEQVVEPTPDFPVEVVDLSGIDRKRQGPELHRIALERARGTFDLGCLPLARACLVRCAEDRHALLFVFHHIVTDGWSMGVLSHEFEVLYDAFLSGDATPLQPLSFQYGDYVLWQRSWLDDAAFATQAAYWRRALGPPLPTLALPTDFPRPPVMSARGAKLEVRVDGERIEALRVLGQAHRASLFMTVMAVFQLTLHDLSDQDDIIVGTDVANRRIAESEVMIGFFVNQLVLRTRLGAGLTFTDLVKRVREVTLESYSHQDLPFDRLVEILNPERCANRTPLFQVKLVLQNFPLAGEGVRDLSLEPLAIDNQTAKFDLLLNLMETDDGLEGSLAYATDLWLPATVAGFWRRFETLLDLALGAPNTKLGVLRARADEHDQREGEARKSRLARLRDEKFSRLLRRSPAVADTGRASTPSPIEDCP